MSDWAERTLSRAVDLLMSQGRADLAADLHRLSEVIDPHEIDAFRLPEAEDLAEELYTTWSLAELSTVLREICRLFSLQHCSIHVIAENSGRTYPARIVTTFSSAWIKVYVDSNFSAIDPVMAHAAGPRDCFYWSETQTDSPIVQDFMKTAVAHGVGPSGYTCVIETSGGDRVGVSVSSGEESLAFYERFSTIAEDFNVIAEIAVDTFSRISIGAHDTTHDPTRDQLRLIRAVAIGGEPQELATIEFESGTLASVEASVLRTFNARTLSEAAIRAARLGFLNNTPLTRNEIYAPSEEPAAVEGTRDQKIAYLKRRGNVERGRSLRSG